MMFIEAAIALIGHDGRWFLQRRDPAATMLPGLWEFPGGKLEPKEAPLVALQRELQEELAWVPGRLEVLPMLCDVNAERELRLHPFRVQGPSRLSTALAWGWFTAEEIQRLPIPPANAGILRFLH